MKWVAFTVTSAEEASDAICEMLLELGAGGVSVLDPADMKQILNAPNSLAFADDSFIESLGTEVVIKAYFPFIGDSVMTTEPHDEADPLNRGHELYAEIRGTRRSINDVKRQIKRRLSKIAEFLPVGSAGVSHELVCAQDWADNWKKDYKTFRISEHVTVSPSWEDYQAEEGEKVILLDPGSAFGTGTHETTAMCAEIMDRIIQPGDIVLDLGCGSGILSILADKLGVEYVEAIDIDRTAVDVAAENIRANAATVNVHSGVLPDANRTDYTIIVANIIADVLIDLCPAFCEYLSPGGFLLISGIIDHRSQEVLAAYTEEGYVMVKALEKGDWHAFLFSRD